MKFISISKELVAIAKLVLSMELGGARNDSENDAIRREKAQARKKKLIQTHIRSIATCFVSVPH